MSSSDRPGFVPRRLVLVALLALAGCGFQPVYAPGGAALALRGSVTIVAPATPFDYRLRTTLEDRLGRVESETYLLTLASEVTEITAAIAPDGSITRYNVQGIATWTLTEATTRAQIAAGQADSFTSYNTVGTTVATRAAQDDAHDRLATTLADMILAQLLIAAPGLP